MVISKTTSVIQNQLISFNSFILVTRILEHALHEKIVNFREGLHRKVQPFSSKKRTFPPCRVPPVPPCRPLCNSHSLAQLVTVTRSHYPRFHSHCPRQKMIPNMEQLFSPVSVAAATMTRPSVQPPHASTCHQPPTVTAPIPPQC